MSEFSRAWQDAKREILQTAQYKNAAFMMTTLIASSLCP